MWKLFILTLRVGGIVKKINNEKDLKNNFNIDILFKDIVDNRLTCKDIEKIYNIDQRFMSKLNKIYNIGIKKSWKQQRDKYNTIGIYKEDLEDYYMNQCMSMKQISKIYNCTDTAIKSALLFFDICTENDIRPFDYIGYYDCRTKFKDGNREHRSRTYQDIMEIHLGRKLTEDEVVHHLDFNRNNNDISNLFLFETEHKHALYHGYIKSHEYIHPNEFLKNIIPIYKNTFLNYNWLYNKYILEDESIAEISRICEVSRLCITNTLIQFDLFNKKTKRVNQYDKMPKNKCN